MTRRKLTRARIRINSTRREYNRIATMKMLPYNVVTAPVIALRIFGRRKPYCQTLRFRYYQHPQERL